MIQPGLSKTCVGQLQSYQSSHCSCHYWQRHNFNSLDHHV